MKVIPFRNKRNPRLTLPFSTTSEAKVAQISVMPDFECAVPFARRQWNEMPAFEPNVLVGYALDLTKLAEQVLSNEIQLPSVDRSIFVLTDCGLNPITEPFRDLLWDAFGVPVFELIVAPGSRLLASECEVHDGWHLQEGVRAYFVKGELVTDMPPLANLHTGFSGSIDEKSCACGRTTVRLKDLTPHVPLPFERRLAAVA